MIIMKAAVFSALFFLCISSAYAQQSDTMQEKFKQAEQLKVLQQKTNQPTAVLPQGKQAEQPNQPSADQKTVPDAINADTQNQDKVEQEVFFKKFMSDSSFQKAHIQFPYTVINVSEEGEEETVITETEYKYFNLLEEDHVYNFNNIDDSGFIVELRGAESGIALNFYCSKLKGQWHLTKIIDQSV